MRSLSRSWRCGLLLGSLSLSAFIWALWLSKNWYLLPNWVPIPEGIFFFFDCFLPLIVLLCGLPTAVAFGISIMLNLGILGHGVFKKNGREIKLVGVSLGLLILSSLPWIYTDEINDAMLAYSLTRYDPIIDAIESYKDEQGQYPSSLELLVPQYLSAVPGIYMKYGERLIYEAPQSTMHDYTPFDFELYGHYAGLHGQSLKYCPIEINPCMGTDEHIHYRRLDPHWIWVIYSAL
jgi:hypothetical protein